MFNVHKILLCSLIFCATTGWVVAQQRIKDVASIAGVRSNQLVGYGLVVGLDGSGDKSNSSPYAVQSLTNLMTQFGIQVPTGTTLNPKNVAAVTITAALPPFARRGQTLDVTVSSIGDARSLRGGTLLFSGLRGADGDVYAVAQGSVIVGGASAEGGGSRSQTNHLNAGRIPAGATVEREVPTTVGSGNLIQIELKEADFTMADQVARTISSKMGTSASAINARLIEVQAPAQQSRVSFLAKLENLNVQTSQAAPLVVVNSRTGSVVMNESVQITAVAVAHGGLSIEVKNKPAVSQPNAFSGGNTVVTNETEVSIQDKTGKVYALGAATRLDQVVKALNTMGATPQDLVSILQAMKAAGALKADLEVI